MRLQQENEADETDENEAEEVRDQVIHKHVTSVLFGCLSCMYHLLLGFDETRTGYMRIWQSFSIVRDRDQRQKCVLLFV